jgi:putative ABC transport system permease protein
MTLVSTLRVAIRALLRNKLRSFLTALGIIIGVGAVIAMVAIGEGAKARVEQSFASMGANMLVVLSGTTTQGGAHGGFGSQPTLTWEDLEAIRSELPSVRYASPVLRLNASISSEETNWTTAVHGVSSEYFDIRAWRTTRGAIFGEGDIEGGNRVVLLGQTVVLRLFGAGVDPVGRSVRIRSVPFTVTGVLVKKGQSPMGQDFDDAVFVPYKTFATQLQRGLQKYIPGSINVGTLSPADTARAERQIAELLRDRHRLQPGADDDFHIRNLAEMQGAMQEGTQTLTLLLLCIAAVSLLVGGIGIMNIMLVSVTERTREIGIRMAVGAKPRTILVQFLVEALTLAIGGGAIGVGVGLLVAERLAAQFGWPMLVRPDIILLAVGTSALVGVGFGLYPAHRASRLDPIEALRYE